jgi:S-adenosylmethionine synthetase|tara:strand:- start:10838 stop:11935 length:1098 start_codon:yes stop_codon:yes gene_type:complete
MKQGNYIFTSESVSAGHPDKVADQISDALVDAGLKNGDETTRIAVETLVTTNHVIVSGETKNFNVSKDDLEQIVREKVKEIGYEQDGFHWEKLAIYPLIHEQSVDIAKGTDEFGAGDQGIMFGYACSDNEAMMPAPIYYAHEILKELDTLRKSGYEYMLPDAKSQVSIEYEGGIPKRVSEIVISHQHTKGMHHSIKMPCRDAANKVLGNLIDESTNWHINPTGVFETGGPDGDTGLTGRKIIVDTYGGYAPHGGGAFSGKDPTKVDRSAAYMARWLAKNVVADEMADWCSIQLSYAIGIKEPTSIYIDSNGHNRSIQKFIEDNIDLTPKGIIDKFDLFNFNKYSENCIYGHFGDKDVPWERIGWK